MTVNDIEAPRRQLLAELGFSTKRVGDELHGEASITPYMYAPGTTHLRTCILAWWTDILSGLLATLVMSPRVPVTVELDVHLYRPGPAAGTLRGVGRTVKSGRSIFVAGVEFTMDDGEPIATGAASFTLQPDASLTLPILTDIGAPQERLVMPLAERARCEHREPGVVVVPHSDEGLNSSNTMNGGIIALAVEEAALSATPGESLCSMGLRFLSAVRVGPALATARVRDGLGQVELRDLGNDSRLAVLATTRTFGR